MSRHPQHTGYDSKRFIQAVSDRGMKAVIHSKPERRVKHRPDRKLYRHRYRVECFFHKLKRLRAVATLTEPSAEQVLPEHDASPLWSGQKLRSGQEEDAVVDEAGMAHWSLRRQSTFHLVR